MGCHTWFKTKSKYTIEGLRAIFLVHWEEWIKRWTVLVNEPENEDRLKIFNHLTQEQMEFHLKVYQRQYDLVKKGIIKQDFIYHFTRDTDEGNLYEIHDGVIYVETDDMPHDIFRKGGYPDTKLTSYDETIDFCKNDGIVLDDHQVASLRKFWGENPVGLIDFG